MDRCLCGLSPRTVDLIQGDNEIIGINISDQFSIEFSVIWSGGWDAFSFSLFCYPHVCLFLVPTTRCYPTVWEAVFSYVDRLCLGNPLAHSFFPLNLDQTNVERAQSVRPRGCHQHCSLVGQVMIIVLAWSHRLVIVFGGLNTSFGNVWWLQNRSVTNRKFRSH